jgi:hypothetical protein
VTWRLRAPPAPAARAVAARQLSHAPTSPRLVQRLGDLHGVQGGTLEQVVADDEEAERLRVGEIAADAPDGDRRGVACVDVQQGRGARPRQRV